MESIGGGIGRENPRLVSQFLADIEENDLFFRAERLQGSIIAGDPLIGQPGGLVIGLTLLRIHRHQGLDIDLSPGWRTRIWSMNRPYSSANFAPS